MLKVIVIGRRSDVLPFRAIGAELVAVEDAAQAGATLVGLRHAAEPIMALMTDEFAPLCSEAIASFRENARNLFLSLPSRGGDPGARMAEIRAMVARSLGVDLLGQKAGN